MLNTCVIVNRYGGSEVIDVIEEPLRAPRKGEIRVKVESAGVALADIMRRGGVYPFSPPLLLHRGTMLSELLTSWERMCNNFQQGKKSPSFLMILAVMQRMCMRRLTSWLSFLLI